MSFYDFVNDKMADTPNMRELRAQLLKDARGRTLEVGFGTGLNVPFYPKEVEHVIAVEPSRAAERKARMRMAQAKVPMEWTHGSGEKLSFPDASFDTVVTTLVLCTRHGDVRTILSEIKRVLKPGGRYLFLEHGLSVTEKGRKLQRRLNGLNKLIIGCRLDSPIRTLLEETAFRLERLEEFTSKGDPPFIQMYRGICTRD
jgi:ubiquinone/menaquinone biosynthesis C-methylase UbiE